MVLEYSVMRKRWKKMARAYYIQLYNIFARNAQRFTKIISSHWIVNETLNVKICFSCIWIHNSGLSHRPLASIDQTLTEKLQTAEMRGIRINKCLKLGGDLISDVKNRNDWLRAQTIHVRGTQVPESPPFFFFSLHNILLRFNELD